MDYFGLFLAAITITAFCVLAGWVIRWIFWREYCRRRPRNLDEWAEQLRQRRGLPVLNDEFPTDRGE